MDIVTYGALNKKVGEKLSSNQGTQNAGKMLGINNEGEIQPIQVLGGNVSVTETLESGEDYSMVIEEGEPTAVTSVAGKYGTVTLDAGDIEYDEQEVYNSGTVGKEVGGLKSQMAEIEGVANIPFNVVEGNYFIKYTNGSQGQAVAGYYATDFIDISGNAKIVFFTALMDTGGAAFYDENQNFIRNSGISYSTGYNGKAYVFKAEVPANAKYFRFTIYTANNSGVTISTAYIKQGTDTLKQLTDTIRKKADEDDVEAIVGSDVVSFTLTNGKAIRGTNGNEENTNSYYNASNYIDVSAFQKIKVFSAFQGNYGCCFYYDNQSAIANSGRTYETGYNGQAYLYDIDVPVDAKYFRFTVYVNSSGVNTSTAYVKVVIGSQKDNEAEFRVITDTFKEPITRLPSYIKGLLSYRPLGNLTKGYICMTADDGNSALATYTIPMLLSKEVPCSFGLYKSSQILSDETQLETLLGAIAAGSVVSMHGTNSFSRYNEYYLNKLLDDAEAIFAEKGITNVYGAICPGQQGYTDTNELIQCVVGGRYKAVCSGGVNEEISYGDYNCAGPRTNMFAINRASVIRLTQTEYQNAIDYAYDNHYVFMPFWHDSEVNASSAYKAILEGMIDYAKTKGLTFITLKDLPSIT